MSIRYFSKEKANIIKKDFAWIEEYAQNLNDPILINLVKKYRSILNEAIGDIDKPFIKGQFREN